MEERGEESRLRRLIEEYQSGTITLEDILKGVRHTAVDSVGPSVMLSLYTMEECLAGRISADKALEIVQTQADLHPVLPSPFLVCAFIHESLGSEMDTCGYFALAMEKERLFYDEDAVFSMLLDCGRFEKHLRRLQSDSLMRTARPYIGKADPFLVKHFLLNDICSYERGFAEPSELRYLLNYCGEVDAVISNFFSDVLRLSSVPSFTALSLMRLIGHVKPLASLDALVESFSSASPEVLNEAVITLAKVGSRYPDAVSERMQAIIKNRERFDEHLPATEVLGYLWKYGNNLEFLITQLEALNPAETHFEYKFCSIALPLLETGDKVAIDAVQSKLWKDRKYFDDQIRSEIEQTIRLSTDSPGENRLEKILKEDIYELCCEPIDSYTEEFRITNTFIREVMLVEEEEIELDNAGFLRLFISTDPEKPCFCRSGIPAKECCLNEFLVLFREIISDYRLIAYAGFPEKLLKIFQDIEEFLFSGLMRKDGIAGIHEFWAPVIRLGMLDSALQSLEYPYADMLFDWLMFGKRFKPGNMTAAKVYQRSAGVTIKPGEQKILRSLVDTHRFSCFEVQRIEPPDRVKLRDIFSGESFEVKDPWMAESLVLWDVVATSIAFTGSVWVSLPRYIYIPRSQLERVEKYIRRKIREASSCGETVDINAFLDANSHRIVHYIWQLCSRYPETTLVTAEGEEITGCAAVYGIIDRDGLMSVLESDPMIEIARARAVPGRQVVYVWFRDDRVEKSKSAISACRPAEKRSTYPIVDECTVRSVNLEAVDSNGRARKLLGIIKARDSRLIFQTASITDLQIGKHLLNEMCVGLISHKIDIIQDQTSLLRKSENAKQESGINIVSRLGSSFLLNENVIVKPVADYNEDFFSKWLEEPCSRLGGRTPKEASRTKKGRAKVNRILKDFENAIEKDGRRGRPVFRLDFLRRKLGISSSLDI